MMFWLLILKGCSSLNSSSILSAVLFESIAMELIPLSGSIPLLINQLSMDPYSGQRVKLSNIFCFNVLSRAEIG